jgi:hypothetical protein
VEKNINIFLCHKLPTMRYILIVLISELKTIIKIQNHYLEEVYPKCISDEKSADDVQGIQYFIFCSLTLTLCKYMEFYECYCDALNFYLENKEAKKIYKELETLDIRKFRNNNVGHIFNKSTGQPASSMDMDKCILEIETKHKSLYAFYLKMYEYNLTQYPLLEHLRRMHNELDKILTHTLIESKK